MPVLKNPKHELFAQGLFEGLSADAAYARAGYAPNRGNATRLKANESITRRVQELLDAREDRIHTKFEVTKERILNELAKIGFHDIRRAVRWHGHLVEEEDNPDGGDTLVIKRTYSNVVELISSDQIDDDTASAIAEVSQSPTGGLKVKFYDKQAALVNMGKHLGMFKDVLEHTGKDGGPIAHQMSPQPTGDDHLEDITKRYALKTVELLAPKPNGHLNGKANGTKH